MRCLVLASDPSWRRAVEALFTSDGQAIGAVQDLDGLLAAHAGDYFDLVLIGSVPGVSPVEACRKLRDMPATMSTYVLAAVGDAVDRVDDLLSAGADDVCDTSIDGVRLRLAVARRRIRRRTRAAGTAEVDGRLVAADRMASMGVLAAGVAHELNNPLSFLTISLDHLQKELAPLIRAAAPDQEQELMGSVYAAAEGCERMRVILKDLQSFARAARWEASGPADVRDVIDASIGMAYNEIRHRARLVRSYGDVDRVDASEARLGQVFLNLLTNAAHAIPVGAASENEIRISVQKRDEHSLVVEVSDTGTGIAPEHLARLFEPFFTTKSEGLGTGLGLAICKRIIDACGGNIDVSSETGIGTTVRVQLPTVRSASEPAQPVTQAPEPLRGRLLIIDDEPHVADALRRLLQREAPDLEVALAIGGDRGLETVAEEGEWDAILCDLMMPHVSGMDVHAELLAKRPELAHRMVFMTGGVFTEQGRQFVEAHADRVLFKPFSLDALLPVLHRMLPASRPASRRP